MALEALVAAQRVVEHHSGADVRRARSARSAGRGTAPAGPGAAPACSGAATARAAPRAPARARPARGSAGRRGSACSTGSTCPAAKSRASTSAVDSPRVAASSAAPAPVDPGADHDDVEDLVRHPLERRVALLEAEPAPCRCRASCMARKQATVPAEMADYVAAIDQGTTSSRCILFDRDGRIVEVAQKEHEQITPQRGLGRARRDRGLAPHPRGDRRGARELGRRGRRRRRDRDHEPARDDGRLGPRDRRARSTTRSSGRTRAPAGSSASSRATRASTGCATPPACRCRPTSRGPKIAWILDNVDGARERAENGELAFGTMDTWVLWNLTGGTSGGVHATDVTNACRTLLMDLETLDWHEPALELMGIPRSMLPEIRSSSEEYGAGVRHRARRAARSRGSSATSRRRCSARPASSAATRRTPTAPDRSCSSTPARDRAHGAAADERRLQARRRRRHLRARGLDRGHRRADPVAARPARDHRLGPRRRGARRSPSTTTATSTSCPRSRGCSPPTGATTRAARSSA